MYRLTDELAKLVMSKIKSPELESAGNTAFLPRNLNSVGIIHPICCVRSAFHYILESPKPVIYQDIPFVPVGVQGYFLYVKKSCPLLKSPLRSIEYSLIRQLRTQRKELMYEMLQLCCLVISRN